MEETMFLNNMLPFDHLLILFSYFERNELITVQRVCHGWREAAQDEYFWKNYTYMLGNTDDERKIRMMPALKNISGHVENNFMNAILESITELRKMNCEFKPPVSSSQVQSLTEKYPGIESVTLDLCAPDITESLLILKASEHPLEVCFTIHSKSPSQRLPANELSTIFSAFTESNTMLTLKTLHFYSDFYVSAFTDAVFRNVISDVIVRKSDQLLSLKFDIRCNVDADILNAVNMCRRLKVLRLDLSCKSTVSINIELMTELTSLFINIGLQNNYFYMALQDSFLKGSWKYLTRVHIFMITSEHFKAEILRAVITNVKHLQSLSYEDMNENTSENELKEIGYLSKLEKLEVTGLDYISEEGISYLARCGNLQQLYLFADSSGLDNLQFSVATMLLSMEKLEDFSLLAGSHAITFSNRNDIDRFISEVLPRSE